MLLARWTTLPARRLRETPWCCAHATRRGHLSVRSRRHLESAANGTECRSALVMPTLRDHARERHSSPRRHGAALRGARRAARGGQARAGWHRAARPLPASPISDVRRARLALPGSPNGRTHAARGPSRVLLSRTRHDRQTSSAAVAAWRTLLSLRRPLTHNYGPRRTRPRRGRQILLFVRGPRVPPRASRIARTAQAHEARLLFLVMARAAQSLGRGYHFCTSG